MATEITYRNNEGRPEHITPVSPLPVSIKDGAVAALSRDYLWKLVAAGKVFVASDGDQDDAVTGQTSFAATTPTFLLNVPAGTVAVPLFVNISQAGTVAGDIVNIIIEMDRVARYASGGTAEKSFNARANTQFNAKSTLYSGATALAGYGIRLWGAQIGQDVSPAEGAVQGPFWRPEIPYMLEGPASLLVYAYAASTGPTLLWSAGWVELTDDEAAALAEL